MDKDQSFLNTRPVLVDTDPILYNSDMDNINTDPVPVTGGSLNTDNSPPIISASDFSFPGVSPGQLLDPTKPADPTDATDVDQNINIACISDEDCLQHPTVSSQCPMFCVENVCAPWNRNYPPPLTLRTGIPVKLDGFTLREDEELEKVFANPPTLYPEQMMKGKFFEVVEGADELLEVKYSKEFLKVAKRTLEDPMQPGHVLGVKDDAPVNGDTELTVDKLDGDDVTAKPQSAATVDDWWRNFPDTSNAVTQAFKHGANGRRLTAIQGQGFDRVHVASHASSPWRRNGRLSMGCTASLIGNRVLLTAAHCVFDRETGSWDPFPTFAAGQDGDDKPYGDKQVWRMIVSAGFMTCRTNDECRAHDWAVLVLRENHRLNVGYFGFSTIKDGQLNLAGYPQSKNREMWYDHCPLHSDEGAWIKHRCDTEPGNSGSAIYKIKQGKRYVVAVHGGGYTNLWNRGADVAGWTSSAGRLFDRMLASRMQYG